MDKNLPILLLKKLSILPTAEVRLELNNELSQKIIEVGLNKFDKKVVVILPKETKEESLGGVMSLPSLTIKKHSPLPSAIIPKSSSNKASS